MKAPINSSKTRPEHFLLDAMTAGASNAIEMQESEGQHSFIGSDTLPIEGHDKTALESFGFKFLGPVDGDPIFRYVEMPKGWKKVPTDHSMWSKIVDERGRDRLAVFYKAAFYDRSAHYSVSRRFDVRKDYEQRTVSVVQVLDGGTVIYSTEPRKHFPGEAREIHMKNYALDDEAKKEATDWLVARYPEWENAAAYWTEVK